MHKTILNISWTTTGPQTVLITALFCRSQKWPTPLATAKRTTVHFLEPDFTIALPSQCTAGPVKCTSTFVRWAMTKPCRKIYSSMIFVTRARTRNPTPHWFAGPKPNTEQQLFYAASSVGNLSCLKDNQTRSLFVLKKAGPSQVRRQDIAL